MNEPLRIIGPFHAMSGYSKFARAALMSARAAGFRVAAVESDGAECVQMFDDGTQRRHRIPYSDKSDLPAHQAEVLRECEATPVPDDCPTLLIQLPGALAGWSEYSSGPRIGWTMSESDSLTRLWARPCENVDLLCLPSRFCEETFRAAVPNMETRLLPCPVDPTLYEPEGIRAAMGGRPDFLFFSCFATVERKGWRVLMQAFTEEFAGESVGLVVLPSRRAEVEEMADWCRVAGAWIQVVEPGVSEEDMAGLYRACDAFALPSAEGFGLPFVEAALCGKPSVALNAGGAAEMVTPETGYPITAGYAPCVGHIPVVYDSSQCFPSASVSAVRRSLRRCVEERAGKGAAARRVALTRFTPEAVAPALRAAVEAACARHATERAVWQGAKIAEVPRLAVIVHATRAESAEQCRLKAEQSFDRLAPLCIYAGESVPGHIPGVFHLPGNPAEARQQALEWLRRHDFNGFVAMIDDTIAVTPGWWEGLAKVFSLRPDVGLLSPQISLWNGKKRGGSFLHFDAGRRAGALARTVILCDMPEPDCYVMRPEVWQAVAYDPRFAWHYDAADVSAQARALGYGTAATAAVSVPQTARPGTEREYLRQGERREFLRKWKGAF